MKRVAQGVRPDEERGAGNDELADAPDALHDIEIRGDYGNECDDDADEDRLPERRVVGDELGDGDVEADEFGGDELEETVLVVAVLVQLSTRGPCSAENGSQKP